MKSNNLLQKMRKAKMADERDWQADRDQIKYRERLKSQKQEANQLAKHQKQEANQKINAEKKRVRAIKHLARALTRFGELALGIASQDAWNEVPTLKSDMEEIKEACYRLSSELKIIMNCKNSVEN